MEVDSVKSFMARAGLEPYGFDDALIRSFDMDRDGSVHVQELLPGMARGLQRFINAQLREENRVLRQQVEFLEHELQRAGLNKSALHGGRDRGKSADAGDGGGELRLHGLEGAEGGERGRAQRVYSSRRRLLQQPARTNATGGQRTQALDLAPTTLDLAPRPSSFPVLAVSPLLAARNASAVGGNVTAYPMRYSLRGWDVALRDAHVDALGDDDVDELAQAVPEAGAQAGPDAAQGLGGQRRKNGSEAARLLYFVPPYLDVRTAVPEKILVPPCLCVCMWCVCVCVCFSLSLSLSLCVCLRVCT